MEMNQINASRISILDGIRAYAVLMVCIVHFFTIDETSLYETNKYLGIIFIKLSFIGLMGVPLFFLLSGFLITGILLDSKKSPKYFSTFYMRRFLRIFPLYYFVLAISFIALPFLIKIDNNGMKIIQQQGWLWTYTSNIYNFICSNSWDGSSNFPWFSHFWSLCVEEHFYIFWPLLVYFTNDKWLPRIMWSIVCISALSVIFVYLNSSLVPILNWSTIKYAGVLSLGGVIAWYHKKGNQINVINHHRFIFYSLGALFILVHFIPRHYKIGYVIILFTSVLFFSFLITYSLENNKITKFLFNYKPLFFVGKISYGIYVYHGLLRPYFIQFIYSRLHDSVQNGIILSLAYTIICTLISILIAWISWELIESPILKYKKNFSY
jgi:peptidoglycan/LPS O-acetylase OafA/YrhL